MAIYFLIYFSLFLCGIHFYDRSNKIFISLIIFFLTIFAGLRGLKVSSDYSTYIEYFDTINKSPDFSLFSFYEPSFVIISKLLPNITVLMLVYAFLSVWVKFRVIKQITPFVFLSVAIWFTHFFLVQEMNQIRAGVAIGLLLFTFPFIIKKDLLRFSIIVLLAGSFHYSALLFFPVYFLNSKKIHSAYFISIPTAYLLNLAGIGLIELLSRVHLSILESKIDSYNLLFSMGSYTKINVYNPVIILRVIFIYIFLFHRKKLIEKSEYFVIMIKMYVISIVSMLLLSSLPAFGLRVADIFGIVEIILLPFMLYLFREKWVIILFLFIFGLGILSLDLFYNKFLNSYSF